MLIVKVVEIKGLSLALALWIRCEVGGDDISLVQGLSKGAVIAAIIFGDRKTDLGTTDERVGELHGPANIGNHRNKLVYMIVV